MDYRALTKLLIKLAAVFIVLYGLAQVGNGIGLVLSLTAQQASNVSVWLVGSLPWAIPLVLGAVLFFFPGAVTNQLIAPDASAQPPSTFSLQRIEEAALAVLGVYILLSALVDAVYWLGRVQAYRLAVAQYASMYQGPKVAPDDWANMCATAAQAVLGVALFLGARGLVQLRDRLRR